MEWKFSWKREKALNILIILFLTIPVFSRDWDSFTFEELSEMALRTLAHNGITCFDFYFVTEDGRILVDEYGEIYSSTEAMLGKEYREKNGVVNIYANFLPLDPEEKLSLDNRLEEMGRVIGIVAVVTSNTSWTSDKLYFRNLNEEIRYWITTKDCRIAYRMDNDKERGRYILNHLHEVK